MTLPHYDSWKANGCTDETPIPICEACEYELVYDERFRVWSCDVRDCVNYGMEVNFE